MLYSRNIKSLCLHYLEHKIQLRLKVALNYIPTVSKLHSRFCWMIYHCLNERDSLNLHEWRTLPPQKTKCRAKQLLDFLTVFQDKRNDPESEVSKYLNKKKICKMLILSNGGPNNRVLFLNLSGPAIKYLSIPGIRQCHLKECFLR